MGSDRTGAVLRPSGYNLASTEAAARFAAVIFEVRVRLLAELTHSV